MNPTLSRRRLLKALGATGAALFLKDILPAYAEPLPAGARPPLFLHVTFDGGWDQLLALDPRDNRGFATVSGPIYPAYGLLAAADPELDALLTSNPSGIVRPAGSNLSFGPAVGRLAEGDLWKDLCILRGVNMGTLTHEVGRRYMLTGKFPQGLQPNGSSLAALVVDQVGDLSTIPNLVVGMETFNEGLAWYASGLSVRSSVDLQTVLTPLGAPLPAATVDAVDAYLAQAAQGCQGVRLDADGLVSQYLASRLKATAMTEGQLGALFAFSPNPTDPALIALNEAFHISSSQSVANSQLAGAAGEAMIAAQALASGISQAVSIKLADNIDHHDDAYLTDHSAALREGFNALADLITFLKATEDEGSGASLWSRTALLVTSDFARTPRLNNRDGRDHHLASSCLVAGPGIRGDQVIGATDDLSMGAVGIDLATGEALPSGGWTLRPPDVHATLLTAAGLSADHLANQDPRVVQAMLG